MPYNYTVSHDRVGNVTGLTGTLMGTWGYGYDALNRLMSATPGTGAPSGYAGKYLCMNYDVYGNRTQSDWQSTACNPGSDAATARYNAANHVTWTTVNSAVNGFQYDAAGDVVNDAANLYEYDAEGRQTGILDPTTEALTGYVYDAEGRRIEKVLVEGWNTPNPQSVIQDEYLLGLNNEQVTVLDGSGNWQWTNVYASGKQLATYDSAGTHFTLTDWLGTKRMQLSEQISGTTATVTVGEQCTSLPYGDSLNCTGSDVNQLYFTGKERDIESNNDYFGARYYASPMGRFLSPDWASDPSAVPYATYTNPQSLNLYTYMRNNPLSGTDPDGHCCLWVDVNRWISNPSSLGTQLGNIGIGLLKTGANMLNMVQSDHDLPASAQVPMLQPSNPAEAATMFMAPLIAPTLAPEALATESSSVSMLIDTTTVTHFTDNATVQAITDAGGLLRQGTYVTTPGEIPVGASSSQVEGLLEITPGKGANSITFDTPSSNLGIPQNGTNTSGGAIQFQLQQPTQIDPTQFVKTN